jgi:hypothetical protein
MSAKLVGFKPEDWQAVCAVLVAEQPHYADSKTGKPNYPHILASAAKCGYSEVTPQNYEAVFASLVQRVAANAAAEAEPAQPEAPEPDDEQPAQEQEDVPVARTWTEAPYSANVRCAFRGRDWQITVRADTSTELLNKVIGVSKWLDTQNGVQRPAPQAQQPPAQQAAPPPPAQWIAQAPPPQAPSTGGVKGGTALLQKLVVNPDGKIEFYLDGMKWPLKDARGAAVVAKLFDPATGWTDAHLSAPVVYVAEVAGMKVDWAQPGKYRDVVRVYR